MVPAIVVGEGVSSWTAGLVAGKEAPEWIRVVVVVAWGLGFLVETEKCLDWLCLLKL